MKAWSESRISVVVPVYNSANTLSKLVDEISEALQACANLEIILVDDGSKDNSWEELTKISYKIPHAQVIKLNRNYGQQSATLCGIRKSTGDIVVTIDDDLQFSPFDIPKLLSEIEEGSDVVYGVPTKDHQTFYRRIGSVFVKWSLKTVFGTEYARNLSSFRAFRGSLRSTFSSATGPFVLVDVNLSWTTTKVKGIKVNHSVRTLGRSSYTPLKLVNHAVAMIVGYSVLPLRFSIITGGCAILFGFGVLCYVLTSYFIIGYSVPGFPFLASIVAIFAGAQLFSIGIIGEYIARIYLKQLGQPEYIVSEESKSVEFDNYKA